MRSTARVVRFSNPLGLLVLGVLYFLLAELGQSLLLAKSTSAIFWPPSGLFSAALLLSPRKRWPWILLALLPANLFFDLSQHRPVWLALLFFSANALEAMTGAWLYFKCNGNLHPFSGVNSGMSWFLCCVLFAPLLGAMVGSSAIHWVENTPFSLVATNWWLGDAVGILTVSPLFLLLSTNDDPPFEKGRWPELAVMVGSMTFLAWVVFFTENAHEAGPRFVLFPFLIWATLRFDFRIPVGVVFGLSIITLWCTKHSLGPFSDPEITPRMREIFNQAFLVSMAVTVLPIGILFRERRQTEKGLLISESALKHAESVAKLGHWRWEVKSGTVEWSDEMYRIFALDKAACGDVMEQAIEARIHTEDRKEVRNANARLISARKPQPLEYRVVWPDGSIRYCYGTADQPVLDAEGKVESVTGIVQDITDRIHAEQARLSLENELHHLQRMESIGRLAGGVAHDINNVLAAVMGLASVIKRRGGENLKDSELMLDACRRGRDLIRRLMEFARKEVTEKDWVDLNALVSKEAELFSKTTLERITVTLDLAPDLPKFMGSAASLSTALMNLFVNAMDAMPCGGILTIQTRPLNEQMLQLVVEDTGCGMPPDVLSRAMEPFFTTKPVGKGTGLGLSMAFGIIQSHGGKIQLQSEIDQGTRILVHLPIISVTPGKTEPTPRSETVLSHPPLRILVVDDDPIVRQGMTGLLETLGHQVTTAKSGSEAIAMLQKEIRWDSLLLDLNMAGMDGVETLKKVRSLNPSLPVLATSGYADDLTLARLREIGQTEVLFKPYSPEELQEALNSVVPVASLPME